LVTQCLLPRTISDVAVKKSYSTMLNIAMKINMKIGGINTKLQEDEVLDNYLYKNNALVIGVDVVHSSAVETHLPSIASVVGNVDGSVTKFHASVKIQPAKQELITGFIEQFSDRLLEYVDVNGTAPKNIIVYRDGVSEGQFMQGTSRPTRYYVLFDESNMDVNAMQSITYYLCHLYGRCARSVSIPAPVYFADLACARARYHILAALNSGLVEKFSDEDSKRTISNSSSKAESVKTELANIIALHKRVKKVMYFA
ncbi:putative protein tag-76, partial [Trichinella nativa]